MIAINENIRCYCITRKILFAYLELALFVLDEVRLADIELADYGHTLGVDLGPLEM